MRAPCGRALIRGARGIWVARIEFVIERLPPAELAGLAGALQLRAPELGSPVLLLVRDDALERAAAHIALLEAHISELRNWYSRPLLVTERAVPEGGCPVRERVRRLGTRSESKPARARS
ncbi:MAG: hypothetical protein ACT4O1_10395 [Gemmatimonadota bacterium]